MNSFYKICIFVNTTIQNDSGRREHGEGVYVLNIKMYSSMIFVM